VSGRRRTLRLMCWQCDNPDKTLDDYLDLLRSDILARGWTVQYVEDDKRPFAYTIGLHLMGLPELLATGLPPKHAQWLLNTFAKRFVNRPVTAGDRYTLPARTRVEIVDVDQPDAHLNMALAIEGPDITAIQLVWADGLGRWPWARGFDDGRRIQPVLGKRAVVPGRPNA
jgi:hypothetical protein